MKKTVTLTLAAMLAIGMLSGCASNNGTNSNSATTETTEVKENFSDEMKIKKVCFKIIELEKSAMKNLMNSEFSIGSDMGRVFTTGDIIIGDSKHASPGIYVPYVDENSIVIKEKTVDPKVKKLIKDYYIDKM